MDLTFLTHYYPPEVGAPQVRIPRLAQLLAERGARVTVHTGFPNYPDGRIKRPYRNRPWRVERNGSLTVVRNLVYTAPNRGFGRRVANHASFASAAVLSAPFAPRADVVIAESPPLFTAAAGVAYAALKRAPLVINVADQWPASAIQLGMLNDQRAIRAASALERGCYRRAAALVVPTEGLLDALGAMPEANGRVRRLGPAVDTARFLPPEGRRGDRLRVLYAGTIGLAQGLGTLVEAARRAGPEAVELWIAGDGAEAPAIRRRLEEEGISNVHLLGTIPHADMPALYREVDVAAVLLRDRPIFKGALPNKVLEAMAAGLPVLLSARGESARLVSGAGAGVVVPPEDPGALAAALLELAGDRDRILRMGEAGRRCALERFCWDRAADGWWRLVHELVAGAGSTLEVAPGELPETAVEGVEAHGTAVAGNGRPAVSGPRLEVTE